MRMNITLEHDQVESIVKQTLLDEIETAEDEELLISLKRVAAWFSVPGEYENGAYDTQC